MKALQVMVILALALRLVAGESAPPPAAGGKTEKLPDLIAESLQKNPSLAAALNDLTSYQGGLVDYRRLLDSYRTWKKSELERYQSLTDALIGKIFCRYRLRLLSARKG